jgi:cysteine-rich repeat protein
MRTRILLPLVLSGSTVALSGCPDDAPVDPDDGSSTGGGSSTGPIADSSSSSSSGVEPDSTGEPPGCGDGLLTEDEGCDDDNTVDGDGCSSTCAIEAGWICSGQPSVCFAVCGDAIITGDEQCDDDNIDSGDGCSVECQLEDGWACEGEPSTCATVCGDGFVVGEVCDDGNNDDGDGCNAACELEEGFSCDGRPSACAAICGDGLVLGDEQCDDSDVNADDGCDATCMVELGWSCDGEPSVCMTGCGDGIVVGSEDCDDMGLVDGDGCDAACQNELGWICMGEPSVCATECGDGFTAGTEQCDDDGVVDGDGCDAACQNEPGWQCSGQPSACVAECGDGLMVGPEACDDGNIAQGDGCNTVCGVDFGWACMGSPSVCVVSEVLDQLALGGYGGCVLTTLGEVGCFGDNTESEVGNGTDDVETYVPAFTLDDAVAVAAGEEFHCAIRAAGTVWCWGDNFELAMGPMAAAGADQAVPIEVTGLPIAAAIEAGDDHVCIIDMAGGVWCWGDNSNLQLGQGGPGTTDSATPLVVALPGGLAATDLGLGQDHTCAVLADATVACWGNDDNGQLGDGVINPDNGVPTLVPGLSMIVDVEAGEDTTCALDSLGQVWCWGDDQDGQLGIGSIVDNPSPQLVALPSAAEAISQGDQFVCALLVDDEVWCWGEGSDFQLGSGDLLHAQVPSQVLNAPAVDLVEIESGMRGTCVLASTGDRWCWGYSVNGQLGFAPLYQLEPVMPSFSGPLAGLVLDRPEIDGVLCGVLLDGTAECSGDGTLVAFTAGLPAAGYFEPVSHHLTLPTTLPLVSGIQQLRMGDSFICVTTATDVQCWGDNSNRQLGQGGTGTTDILTPVPVMGLGAVDELELGGLFACVRVGGTVQCWGNNSDLQTGEGSGITDQSLPVTVMGLADATAITLGEGHGCALRSTGVVSCWGEDLYGQLGDADGDAADSSIPVDVTGLPPGVAQIAAGQDHTCALAGGEVYCWGEAAFGNLGQNDEVDSDTALLVPGLAGVVQIAAGYNYACALDGAGDMWCWGESTAGQLGDGGRVVTGLTEVRSPTPFAVASGITDVVAGRTITCIETAAGWSCVGGRSSGQLGNGTTVEPVFPMTTLFGL